MFYSFLFAKPTSDDDTVRTFPVAEISTHSTFVFVVFFQRLHPPTCLIAFLAVDSYVSPSPAPVPSDAGVLSERMGVTTFFLGFYF